MKNKLVKLYKEYLDYVEEHNSTTYGEKKNTSFEGFMYWLENGWLGI